MNITHSVDNYIKDIVVEKFKAKKKNILTIHDCFGVHPNDVDFLMRSYREALARVFRQRVIENIIRQISGNEKYEMPTIDNDKNILSRILTSKYALS